MVIHAYCVSGYWWLLMVIILMVIVAYYISGYWWLLMAIILVCTGGY